MHVADTANEAGPDGPPDPPPPDPQARHLARSRPRWVAIMGGVGTVFIILGLLVLGFAVYLLWGTGIRTHQAQHDLKAEFNQQLDAAATSTTTSVPATAPTTAGSAQPSATTTSQQPVQTVAFAPKPGQPVAHIEIPAIGLDWITVEGTGLDQLAKGPGHYLGTPFPGQAGNVAIAGHRTTHGAPFNRVDELKPGDQIFITTLQGTFTYVVTGQQIVSPKDTAVIQDQGDNRLTLTSCHPKFSASKRIVISASLTTPPVPAPPVTAPPAGAASPDGSTTLGPDDQTSLTSSHGHWGDSVVTGLICLALGLGAWQLGVRRLGRKRWFLYLAVTPLFLAILFFFYEDVSSLLPSDF